jgi:hypothetical protein
VATIDLTVTLKDSDLDHEDAHRFVELVTEALVKAGVIDSGDVVETTCGFGVEIGQKKELPHKYIPMVPQVAPTVWGGPN